MKEFNVTGTCIPQKHYMVNIDNKLNKIMQLVEKGKYFVINRPRQYGKTTALFLLNTRLKSMEGYLPIKISFEGIGSQVYTHEESFIQVFLDLLINTTELSNEATAYEFLQCNKINTKNMNDLSKLIHNLIKTTNSKIVLMIDEVDKSSNNQLFLDFLGMLRAKYLLAAEGTDFTFHSIILAGVHDVKTLKTKIRPDDEHKYNSPWNIAADFNVDMSFSKEEILTMLEDYISETEAVLDKEYFSERLYYVTSGYPFLVSQLCKIIDEDILEDAPKVWKNEYLELAIKMFLMRSTTNSDSLIKNLENNQELYQIVLNILIKGEKIEFNINNPNIYLGTLFGIFKNEEKTLVIHNKIYEQLIYNYMTSKLQTSASGEYKSSIEDYNYKDNFIDSKENLDFEKILLKFQEFMRVQFSEKDQNFIEREGRLLFLAFVKPIINGKGFDFKEPQISEEKRLDIVITYGNQKYVVELKLWKGQAAHERGINQLEDYLVRENLDNGYLVIFDFSKGKNKEWKTEYIKTPANKDIYAVWV